MGPSLRRTLLVIATLLTLLLLIAGITVNLLSSGALPTPTPDPLMPITLGDGSVLPLAEVLARSRRAESLHPPGTAGNPTDARGEHTAAGPGDADLEAVERPQDDVPVDVGVNPQVWHASRGPVFALAEEHLHKGNLDQAEALYLSIAEGESDYAYAQRRLGWHILAKARGQPERGVAHAHAALLDEPLNGNSWQDVARVYAATLGFDPD